jgi:hypothetical protein
MIEGMSWLVAVVVAARAGAVAAIIAAAASRPRAAVAATAGVTVVLLVVVGVAGTSALAEVGREAPSAATAAAAAAATAGESGQKVPTRVSRGAGGRSMATGRGGGIRAFPLPAAVSCRQGGGRLLEASCQDLVDQSESHPGVGRTRTMYGPPTRVGGQDL